MAAENDNTKNYSESYLLRYNGTKIENIYNLIGNTPLIKINSLSKQYNCNIYLKLEKYNYTGSSKDRAVYNMIIEALNENKINISK